MAGGWVISADVKPKLGWASPQPFAKPLTKASEREAAPTGCQMQLGQELVKLPPGTESKLFTTRRPPKYGWLSGPKALVRVTARLLLPTCMQETVDAGGEKKSGLIGRLGSPGSPSGLRQAQTLKSLRSDVTMAN